MNDIYFSELHFDKTERKNKYYRDITNGMNNMGNILIADTFNRTNDTDLGTTPTLHEWEAGAGGIQLALTNKTAKGTDAVNHISLVNASADNIRISLKFNSLQGGWIRFRHNDSLASWRFGTNSNVDKPRLQKLDGGVTNVFTDLGNYEAGDIFSVELVGNVIACRINGVIRCTTTDAFGNAYTKHGIQCDTLDASFSEFYIETI